jgi:capsular polysaccharide biosynthesis protein
MKPTPARATRAARRLAARVERTLRDRRLLAGVPAPSGTIASVEAWRSETDDGRLLPGHADTPTPATSARTVGPGAVGPFAHIDEPRLPPLPPRCVVVAPGARVATPAGLVITADNRILTETAWSPERVQATGLLHARRLPAPARVTGTHASLVSEWSWGYFHWVMDVLPRLEALEQNGYGDVPLIVGKKSSAFQLESLRLLGHGRVTAYTREHLQPEVLVWPAPVAPTGHTTQAAVRFLRDRLTAAAGRGGVRRKLYVQRAAPAGRRVANEDELLPLLRRRGFEIVRPELLPFAAQVRTFADASVVVGPHGAGLANIVFAKGATVVELFEPGYVNLCYCDLAAAAGHDYWYLVGTTAGMNDIVVNPRDVELTLDRAET